MDIVHEKSNSSKPVGLLNTNKQVKQLLQERLEFYISENKKLENALTSLRILDDNGAISNQDTSKIIERLADVQEKFGVDKFNSTAMTMVHVEHLYDTEDISGQLQRCLNLQSQISSKVSEESIMVKCALADAEKQVSSIDIKSEELQSLKSQLKKYESEILKYEERYPWLKDSSSDLLEIVGKTEDLKLLQYEEIKLLEELDRYKGLQPDLAEAHQQLIKIKGEYEKVNSEMFNLL